MISTMRGFLNFSTKEKVTVVFDLISIFYFTWKFLELMKQIYNLDSKLESNEVEGLAIFYQKKGPSPGLLLNFWL